MILEDVSEHVEIHIAITVNNNVAKARCSFKPLPQRLSDETRSHQRAKKFAIGPWLPQALPGHNVRSHVQGSLNRYLEGVFSKSPLLDVRLNLMRSRQGTQLLYTSLDERDLLLDELKISHRGTLAFRPTCSTIALDVRQNVEVFIACSHFERNTFGSVTLVEQHPVAENAMHEIRGGLL
jgi:hypothetical protein